MGKQMKFVLEADFNYSKYSIVKKAAIVLFAMCWALLIFSIAIKVAYFFLSTPYEAVAFSVSFLISWVIFDYLLRKLYKKLFSKRVKIFQGHNDLTIWINGEEIQIKKEQIKKVKAKAVTNKLRRGGKVENTKLIIYTTIGKFHFTNDQAIYAVKKLMKFAPAKKQ